MVMFLVCTASWGATLFRGRRLLEGGAYSDLNVNGEEIQYLLISKSVTETESNYKASLFSFFNAVNVAIVPVLSTFYNY